MSSINQTAPSLATPIDAGLPEGRVERAASAAEAASSAPSPGTLSLPGVATAFAPTALLGLRRPSSALDVSIALAEAASNLDQTMGQARSIATIASFAAALSAARALDPASARERVAADHVLHADVTAKAATFAAEHQRLTTALEGPTRDLAAAQAHLAALQEEAAGEPSEERAAELPGLMEAAGSEITRLEGEVSGLQGQMRTLASSEFLVAYGVLDDEVRTLPEGSEERETRAAVRDAQTEARSTMNSSSEFAQVESALAQIATLYAGIGTHLQTRIAATQALVTQFGALSLFARVQAATVLSGRQTTDASLNQMRDDLLEEVLRLLTQSASQSVNAANPLLRPEDVSRTAVENEEAAPEPPSRAQLLAATIAASINDLLTALEEQRELAIPQNEAQRSGRRVLLEI